MVTFAEEIMLLVLDDQRGEFKELPGGALAFAIAGAVLMDLAMWDRIDSDLDTLVVINDQPTGESLLDPTLVELAASRPRSPQHWLRSLASRERDLREQVLQRLVARGVLRREEERFLWVFPVRRYPTADGTERTEVKTRLRELILGDELPDPRDAALVGLVETCRLFGELLSQEELLASRERIMAIARLDLIGQQVVRAVREIEHAVGLALRH